MADKSAVDKLKEDTALADTVEALVEDEAEATACLFAAVVTEGVAKEAENTIVKRKN